MWWRLPFALSVAAIVSSSSPPCANLFELELGLYPPRILHVAGRHVGAVYLDHVRLEVERGAEDDEFLRLTGSVGAWVVGLLEMLFLSRELQSEFVPRAYSTHQCFPVPKAGQTLALDCLS